jgi:hypothetical protein
VHLLDLQVCALVAAAARKRGGQLQGRSSWEPKERRGEERRGGQQWRWRLLLDERGESEWTGEVRVSVFC